jgi:23S rRNA (pseudouridine1915-N3)-methyltransferase
LGKTVLMIITIIAVGKTKKDFVKNGIIEYEKRIAKYGKIKWIWVEPSKESLVENRISEETIKISKQLPEGGINYMLDKSGTQYTSEQFAAQIEECERVGKITFVIGGSDGVDLKVLTNIKLLSFSKATFEHDLVRLILLEQLYRGFDINAGGEYHK